MEHFKLEQWADYARGVVPADIRNHMESHLHQDCDQCTKSFQMMATLADFAQREAGYEPPADALHWAKALAAVSDTPSKAAISEVLPLVFDSALQPVMAGVRGPAANTRQLLYQKEDCSLDIRLEEDPRAKQLNVLGQILNTPVQGRGIGSILVEAFQGKNVVGSTATNGHGEFHFSVKVGEDLQLCFAVSSSKSFWVKIPPLQSIPERGMVISD